jgi:choice-of-anchor B domain-containing protein
MNKILTFLFCLLLNYSFAQHVNVELVGQFDPNETANDLWGYVDNTGIEYAILGTNTRTIIISLEDPAKPEQLFEITGSSTTWRDIKSYEDHLYVIADGVQDGLLVINMSNGPDSITYEFYKPEIVRDDQIQILGGCHNLYIEEERGILFLSGCREGTGGIIIMDLKSNKSNPEIIGLETLNYSHDVFAKGDRMYTSEINVGQLGIYDISDPTNPKFLASQPTSSNFTHNAWTSDDQKYVFTTDEVGNATIDAFDISDLDFIEQIDRFKPSKTANRGVIPHNTHYHQGFLVTSWYTDGVVITDASRPHNLIEVGNYDTWPGADGGFNGCWGAFPYLPSGLILASDRSTGLYILSANYVKACYLEGTVVDKESGIAINNASVELVSSTAELSRTNALGEFATGQLNPGEFGVQISHPEYESKDSIIQLENGKLTFLNIELIKKKRVIISGTVVQKLSNEPIADAQIVIKSKEVSFPIITDSAGNFSSEIFEGTYILSAGKWGYINEELVDLEIKSNNNFIIELSPGYRDDFIVDLGWKVSGDASTGNWELGIPNASFLDGFASNPGADIADDIGNECYVTGNQSGTVGEFDIDNGATKLSSPLMDLTNYNNPVIEYDIWFFNSGGGSAPNDSVVVMLNNGTEEIILENLKDASRQEGFWRERRSFPLNGLIELTDQMYISIQAVDSAPGHIVEAAFDRFLVREETISSSEELEIEDQMMEIYPNPVSEFVKIKANKGLQPGAYISLYNLQGHELFRNNITSGDLLQWHLNVADGIYIIHLMAENQILSSSKIVKITH